MTVRIVTDSTADLDPPEAAAHRITVAPLTIHFGETSYHSGIDLSKDEFYARMPQSAVLPRTSQPSPGVFLEAYESLKDADGIVSIHISGKLSGTVNSARTAAAQLPAWGPPVEIVDSDTASMGLGFAVLAAAEAAEKGADLQSVARIARETAARVRLLLFVDTLEYLQQGGRIGRARAFLGTLLQTKPVLELRQGEIEGIERPRTRQRAIERLHALILRTPNPQAIAVLYGSTPEEAAALAERLRQTFPGVAVSVVQCSPVIGVHTGPGALGAAILRREA